MIIGKGAEAVITREDNTVVKDRIKKSYRISEIDDKLRKRRTALEARLLREARRAGVPTPQIFEENKTALKMEFIDGQKIKDCLNSKNCTKICGVIGRNIALLHNYDIIHGDLTTSNMIFKKPDIYFIDFGLGFISKREEDKAVDLYLLHEALESTHFEILEKAWKIIITSYKKYNPSAEKVIRALTSVESRGRYKDRGEKGKNKRIKAF